MLTVTFSDLAVMDMMDAYDWYEQQYPGLGERFFVQVNETVGQIQSFPASAVAVGKRLRKRAMNQFPYGIFYRVDDDIIRIEAVMHNKRDPKVWQERILH